MTHGLLPVWNTNRVKATLTPRKANSHKGTYGTGLLVAGSPDMPGAALLAGLGAMRSGIGKLEIGTDAAVIPFIVPSLPEATYLSDGLQKIAESTAALTHYRAAAIGPGLNPSQQVELAVQKLIKEDFPVILDAGALTERNYEQRRAPVILTPHPKEFERLTGLGKAEVAANRPALASEWAKKLGVTVVLKGNGTVIAFPDGESYLNPTGNAALAKGGTGDTLTGMLLGMLCCHDNWKHAVLNAVFLHGACADYWTRSRSSHTLLASELTNLLPEVWRQYE